MILARYHFNKSQRIAGHTKQAAMLNASKAINFQAILNENDVRTNDMDDFARGRQAFRDGADFDINANGEFNGGYDFERTMAKWKGAKQ